MFLWKINISHLTLKQFNKIHQNNSIKVKFEIRIEKRGGY